MLFERSEILYRMDEETYREAVMRIEHALQGSLSEQLQTPQEEGVREPIPAQKFQLNEKDPPLGLAAKKEKH
tara:strand:+ start:478 stop:693 length:216 start_codon:yes stop_codon:yes gene_type:complete